MPRTTEKPALTETDLATYRALCCYPAAHAR